MRIALWWPPKELSPNARVHWARKSKAAKFYREHGRITALKSGADSSNAGLTVEIIFYPPDRRRRDLDNLIASMKPALDGIADALGVDDSKFKLVCSIGEELRGCVEILM